MADGKKLTFSVILDEASFQRVKRAMGELTTEAAKMARQLNGGGVFGGGMMGANFGRQPAPGTQRPSPAGSFGRVNIGSAILGDVEAFKKLAKSSQTAMAAMTESVRRGIREQESEIGKLDKALNKISASYLTMNDAQAKADSARMLDIQKRKSAAEEQLKSLQEAEKGLTPQAPGAEPGRPGFFKRIGNFFSGGQGQGGGGGGMGGMGRAAQNLMQGNVGGLLTQGIGALAGGGAAATVGGIAAIAGAGVIAAFRTNSALNARTGDQFADRGRIMGGMMERAQRGDITDQMKMRYVESLKEDERTRLLSSIDMSAGSQARFGQAASTGWELFKSGITGDLSGNALRDLAMDNKTSGYVQELLEKVGDDSRYKATVGRVMDYSASTSGARAQSARIGGRGYYTEKVFNMNTGKFEDDLKDTHSKTFNALTRRGLVDADLDSATIQARGLAGKKFAGKEAWRIMEANAAGYAGYGQMAAGASRAGSDSGFALWDDIKSKSGKVVRSGIDKNAGLLLGQGIWGQGFDPKGTTTGNALLGAIQGPGFNFNGKDDFNEVQRALGGIKLGDSLTSGSLDTYQLGRNAISAIQANPGGSTYSNDYLSTMNMQQLTDLAAGKGPAGAGRRGLTKEMAQKQLAESARPIMERWKDQGGTDVMSTAMRGWKNSGLDPVAYAKQLFKSGKRDEAMGIGDWLGQASGEGDEYGEGLVSSWGGLGGKGKAGKSPGGSVDAEAKARLEAVAKQQEESQKLLAEHFKTMMKELGEQSKYAATVNGAALGGATQAVIDKFYELAGVTPEVRKKIEAESLLKGGVFGKAMDNAVGRGSNQTKTERKEQ